MATKALLINPYSNSIQEVEINGLDDIYKLLDCDCIDVATNFENGDAVYVDDEGLFKGHTMFFEIKGAHQPFAGKGLIVGTDNGGNDINYKTKRSDLTSLVDFKDIFRVKAEYS